jgi:cytochrome d ubiquinol oxidase subunit II
VTGVEAIWYVMGAGVLAYALTGGADFGGGIWHLVARGGRQRRHRAEIEQALAPIWEANHVWLIFVIVLLFSAFPRAFAALSTALHIPISLALVGIVLRGSAFVFHSYDLRERPHSSGWSLAFGLSSLWTPLALGDVLGAVSTGAIRWDGERVTSGFFAGWPTLFAFATGVFTAALFGLLAAVYLTVEVDADLREDFRTRALSMEVVAGVLALIVFVLAEHGAPALYENLARSAWTIPVQATTAVAAIATVGALFRRRYRAARITVAVQVALVVVGWGLAMRGTLIMPDLRLDNAGARDEVIEALLPALAVGAAALAPSLWYLFRVFKRA